MQTQTPIPVLEPVEGAARAELLLHPLRQEILAEASEPSTSAEIARRIGLPPQKVNYHVRTLVDAGFLRPAGETLKRNLVEKRYRASAQSYVLLPQVLGEVRPDALSAADRFSATYLLQLSTLLQQEVACWLRNNEAPTTDVPTLSLEAELRFDSAEQRASFASALQTAVADVIGRHSRPAQGQDGSPRPGHAYRLVLGCYPIPEHEDPSSESSTSPSHEKTK